MKQHSEFARQIVECSTRLARFFAAIPFSAGSRQPESSSYSGLESQTEQPFSGGYNEAFVIQYWSSYNLR